MKIPIALWLAIILAVSMPAWGECPLDHFILGCNRDGIEGTADDKVLFVDSWQKYRDSDEEQYANWFYPLNRSIFTTYPCRVGEPGFDTFQADNPSARYTYDPNCALEGNPDVDYRITVECVALSAGLRAVHKDYPQFTLDAVGQTFSHSSIQSLRGDSHMHMSYQAVDGTSLHWITFRAFDSLEDGDRYEPSPPFTIVFNVEPLAGDLVVDGRVDVADLSQFSRYWLSPDSSRHSDYCERADTNRDGSVNFADFAHMASNWRMTMDK
ncbi:MAG: dockerin type I domain-containing protein [Planctomycetes bacterium]|jgi:hypothetical protein|nr:dockerin type I domain-containing protein [Planctomycetota bacterium]